jgi:hypothetical protein
MKNHHLRPVGAAPLPEVHHAQNKAMSKRKFNGSPLENPKIPPNRRGCNFKKNLRHKENKRARGNEKLRMINHVSVTNVVATHISQPLVVLPGNW